MRSEWKTRFLYDLAEWRNGLAFRNISFSETGKPIIKIAELKNGITGQTRFTKKDFDSSVALTKGDMLFSWSGNPETSIDVFTYDLPDGWLNQHIFKVTPREVDKSFLFYLLKYLRPVFAAIASNKQTTGLGHVTIKDMKELSVLIPPRDEQINIAKMLSSIDDQINLNTKINNHLAHLLGTDISPDIRRGRRLSRTAAKCADSSLFACICRKMGRTISSKLTRLASLGNTISNAFSTAVVILGTADPTFMLAKSRRRTVKYTNFATFGRVICVKNIVSTVQNGLLM